MLQSWFSHLLLLLLEHLIKVGLGGVPRGHQQKGEEIIFIIIPSINNTMTVTTFCSKTSKKHKCNQMGDPGTKSYQIGVCGLLCVSSGVIDVKKFEPLT